METEVCIWGVTDFGQALNRRRHDLGISKADAAASLGFTTDDLTAIEEGHAAAPLGKAIRYASYLRMDIYLRSR